MERASGRSGAKGGVDQRLGLALQGKGWKRACRFCRMFDVGEGSALAWAMCFALPHMSTPYRRRHSKPSTDLPPQGPTDTESTVNVRNHLGHGQ